MVRRSDLVEARLPGRDHELDRIEHAVAGIDAQAPFLVIRGDAGIGKTALWRAGLKAHRAAGHRVLVARPTEDELQGAMVVLTDLFDDVPAGDALDPDADLFDRARAVLRLLRRLAVECPVVVAIDDLQWCDPISARALRYALRRLDDAPVAALATERESRAAGPPEIIPPERFEEMILGPLPIDAIRQVINAAVGPIPRPALQRIHALAGGNPLYAVELARSPDLVANPLGAVARPTLAEALSERLAGATPDMLEVLRTAAALGPCSAAALADAAGQPTARVSAAVDTGVLTVGDDLLVRFSHPLLASVVLGGMNPLERQAVHAHLAEIVTDPDDRARHLALSATEPDPEIAAELEQAARRAGRRGAPALAAELATHSLRLTPPQRDPAPSDPGAGDRARVRTSDATRRSLIAISYRAAAGETRRALALTDELVDRLGAGPGRAQAITQRVYLDFNRSEEYLERALVDAGDDLALRGRVLELRGFVTGLYRGQLARGMELSEQALQIAVDQDDHVLEVLAASMLATTSLLAGRPRHDLMHRALQLAEVLHERPPLGPWPHVLRARQCVWGGYLAEARRRFEAQAAQFARTGIEFHRPYRLADRARIEVAAGNLAEAIELGQDGLEAARDAGNAEAATWTSYPVGLARAHRGETAAALDAAGSLHSWGQRRDNPPRVFTAHHIRAVVALSSGDGQAAASELLAAVELARRSGHRHPGYVPFLPDAVEATALAGDRETCEALVAELEDQAADLREPWTDAAAERARGLHALVTGTEDAAERVGAAAEAFDALGYRLDAARTLLLQGRALRRSGRRRAAADVLDEAHGRFTGIGATPWAALAAEELRRVAPGRDRGELTPTESQIAQLVAEGRRNREIAGELFVSVATVEAHLTRIYRKLGMRSRTELSRHVLADRSR
ncbi:MAG: LuxR C-terminal-related transcriptional regulator [Acidimicrobiia bacterium]